MQRFDNIRQDLPASLVVFLVAVPLCLGIALASGAPLFSGLIAGMVGGTIVGLISRSPLGVSGPAAGLAVIVYNSIEELGSFRIFLVAVVIAGAIQVAMGMLRAGLLAYFFPASVIKGMLAGIGVLIILKQIPHALGHDSDPEGDVSFEQPDGETTFSSLSAMFDDFTLSAIIVSFTCLAILILWESVLGKKGRFFQIVQGPLVAVVFGIGYQFVTSRWVTSLAISPDHLVSIPVAESLSKVGDLFTSPDWSALGNTQVWVIAITIAVVASLETLLCVEATDKLDPQNRVTPTNRELVAQGVGNMLSGGVGGLPVTQVIVRSSANIQSGARTRLSAICHGILLLIFSLALPELLNMVPLAALAAVLLVVGYKLTKPSAYVEMWKKGPTQFWPYVITIVAIVRTDLLTGIGLGMVSAIFVILRGHYLNSHFLHIEQSGEAGKPHKVTLRLAEEVTFLNKGAVLRELDRVPEGSVVTIDASSTVLIDQDVLEIFDSFEASAGRRSIEVRRVGNFDPDKMGSRGASGGPDDPNSNLNIEQGAAS